MNIKFTFGKGSIIADRVVSIDCPNQCGGIGDISLSSSEGFWTGDVYVKSLVLDIHFGSCTKIETRSNLDESDEEWRPLWERPVGPFKYGWFYEAALLVKNRG